MKILLVDDSIAAREPVRLHLNTQRHQVKTADHGDEALKIFSQEAFDLVITDIRMPGMNGLDLMSSIKRAKPEQDVMIVTGYGNMESSLQALRLGATNYLLKPINLEELSMAVRAVEKRQAMAQQLKEKEARLIQARKMADLGLVAAGVAHEINNPNTFIRGNLQTLQRFWEVCREFILESLTAGVPSPPKLDFILQETPKMFEAMLDGTERIKKIVESTATFTRLSGDGDLDSVDLNHCLRLALTDLDQPAKWSIISTEMALNLPLIQGHEDEIIEIIRELLRNSLRAVNCRESPRINIKTEVSSDQEVLLRIEDNGVGIEPEDQGKIFTPFFTTDPRIGRPGLGLSKVYALVRAFGGELFFTSQPGEGSIFTVRLKTASQRTPQ